MMTTVRAVYTGGVLRPAQPLPLAEGAIVELTVAPVGLAPTSAPASEEDVIRRVQEAKTYHEWLEVTKSLPPDDGGYDIIRALDENRRWSGDRPLLPTEGRR
jgi:predicted DNA-binding antitoxin AbrB/MazE fold protein